MNPDALSIVNLAGIDVLHLLMATAANLTMVVTNNLWRTP